METPTNAASASMHPQLSPAVSRGIWMAILGTLLMRILGTSITYLLQIHEGKVGAPAAVVGFIGVSFYLTELFGAPYFGSLVDRQGWRRYMVLGPPLAAVAVLLTWAAIPIASWSLWLSVFLLFITRLLEGVCVASNSPATLSFLSAASRNNEVTRDRLVGYFSLSTLAGLALGGVVGTQLDGFFGVAAFGVMAIGYMLCALIFSRVPNTIDGVEKAHSDHHSPLEILRQRSLWTFAPAWIAVNALIGVWLNNLAYQLTLPCSKPHAPDGLPPGHEVHVDITAFCARMSDQHLVGSFPDPKQVGNISFWIAICFVIGMLAWTRILPRLGLNKGMYIALSGGVALCASIFGFNVLLGSSPTINWSLAVALSLSLLVLSGFTPAALAVLMEIAEKHSESRGAVMGAYSVFLGIGQFLGGGLGGFFAGWLGINGLILMTLISTIIAVVFVRVHEKTELKEASAEHAQPTA